MSNTETGRSSARHRTGPPECWPSPGGLASAASAGGAASAWRRAAERRGKPPSPSASAARR